MTYKETVKEANSRMDKSLEHLVGTLRAVRTGRASAALVENIKVDYYGSPTPISQLGTISVPEPRQIMIKPFDLTVLPEIEKAIQKSDLGIAPQSDGKVVRLTLPQLSGEQRKKYAAKVKDMCEETRISMRNGRRDLNKQADAMEKKSVITEDEHRKLLAEIQEILKASEKNVDEVLKKKTTEIMDL